MMQLAFACSDHGDVEIVAVKDARVKLLSDVGESYSVPKKC